MNTTEMGVAYQLQSEEFQVFYSREESSFIVIKDRCLNCKNEWIHSIQQCIFCASENYFLWICNSCGKLRSLQNANPGKLCECGDKYYQSCFNENCVSRSNPELVEFLKKFRESEKGIFTRGNGKRSGFTIAQHFCFYCAHEQNFSEDWDLKVFDLDNTEQTMNDLYKKYKEKFNFLIFVKEQRTKYLTLKNDKFDTEFKDKVDLELFKPED